MPEIRSAHAREGGSLFCIEHPGEPAAHILVIGLVKLALCARCWGALADITSSVRFPPSFGRNSWSRV